MQVIQATFGTFHHFHLARELRSRGYLNHIYSTYPWQRLKREGLPHDLVSTFPWLHTPHLVAGRYLPKGVNQKIANLIPTSYDSWLCNRISACDAYVALSGAGEKSGRRAQELGAKYVCDRGSSHARYQRDIMLEEYRRWGVTVPEWRDPAREESEYDNADAITVLSSFAKRSFLEHGVPEQKIQVTLLGVQLDAFRQTAEPAPNSFEVLFVGTASFRKGIPYLLEAFRKLQHPRKRLRIVGTVAQEITPYLKTQDLSDVEITGPRPQAKLPDMMSQSHVLVLPSIEDGFGMVITQAMACGCPVISSTNTGGPDIYTNGKEGFIVPIRSSETVLNSMQQLADDPSLQQAMSEASLRRVQSFGGWSQYGQAYTAFLKKLCGFPGSLENSR
jgi:glycosyltransferase involved in cell wall biosynthesis